MGRAAPLGVDEYRRAEVGDAESLAPAGGVKPLRALALLSLPLLLSGCVVVTVAGAAVSVGATVVETAVDVTVGAAKLAGKAVGSAVDAMTDDEPPPAAEPKPAR
jgi:hypothetical protein